MFAKDIIKNFPNVPDVAKWKAIILKYGIRSYIDCGYLVDDCKIKYAIKNPKSFNQKVYDFSISRKIIPSEIIIKDSKNNISLVKLRYDPKSFLGLSFGKSGFFLNSINGNEKKKIPLHIELVKQAGDDIVNVVGKDRMSVMLFDGCWNWNTGKPCFFCDLNPKRKEFKTKMPDLNNLADFNLDYEKWWNYYKKDYFEVLKKSLKKSFAQSAPHKHLIIMAGGFIDNYYLWTMTIEILERINAIIPLSKFDNYLNITPPIRNKEYFLNRVKDMGIKQVQFNLEVVGKESFEEICPGKAENIGYDNYIESLKLGSKIFGFGKSRSNFVLGAQPFQVLLEGIKDLAQYGIVADYSIFQPKKGTVWENKKSPSLTSVIDFTIQLAEVYKKYKFKPIYCNLSSRSSIINEILN